MSSTAGIDPTAIAELEWPMLEALERALADRWTPLESMLADLLELTHALFVAYIASHVKKGTKLPAPLRVPRPGVEAPAPAPLSPLAFALAFGPRTSSSSRGSPNA